MPVEASCFGPPVLVHLSGNDRLYSTKCAPSCCATATSIATADVAVVTI